MLDQPGRLLELRASVRAALLMNEADAVRDCTREAGLTKTDRETIVGHAVELVHAVRGAGRTPIMQAFLVEYGLSSREGVALMCLAEALLRIPDTETIDDLIKDKIVRSDWASHLGSSTSSAVNASTRALHLTGKVLGGGRKGLAGVLHRAVRRIGKPIIRTALARAMRQLGHRFVLGRDMREAKARAAPREASGYTYSYDMLGEAARTAEDARRYHLAYSDSIVALEGHAGGPGIGARPGVSVKLSALHARYEFSQRDRVLSELVGRLHSLALLAKSAGIGLNVDAEEADRLELSLDVIEAVLADPALAGWDGFGVVVQAYGKRAPHVIDWLYGLAGQLERRIMVRLVKGAYWDSEIKRAQTLGLDGFPVFTRKACTDVSYLACTRKLLGMTDRIYPQFATHNAHTIAAVLHMADDTSAFEFQRLHGMGAALHEAVRQARGVRCRIYAPVGAHSDLVAYLVRRLLENGANSSFVNQIVDTSVTPEEIARDPLAAVEELGGTIANPRIAAPADLFLPERRNSKGWDVTDPLQLAALERERQSFRSAQWEAAPPVAGPKSGALRREVRNPARHDDVVGYVTGSASADIAAALAVARKGAAFWASMEVRERASRVRHVADLYEAHAPELFALAAREAGKTMSDSVAEVREACDFARFYANEAIRECGTGNCVPLGIVACISPWNFPLAIFSGQILAALAAGNAVVAKPAEQTPLIADRAVALMHEAGIPRDVLQLLFGDGERVGSALVSNPQVDGVCFTGSTQTARRINRAMAECLAPRAPLIAETGGLNAMIVDSTALPEQAVRDIVVSAFQSAGQRCSALRILYIQQEVEERILAMLYGAIDELRIGDPWDLAADIGPIIDRQARDHIEDYCSDAERDGRLLKRAVAPGTGLFVPPSVVQVDGIESLSEEIFGPVLHVATYAAEDIDAVLQAINAAGYGLTFGLHTRIDDRVQHAVDHICAGNIYVNRNQIGAVVGSQPFGGEGESGTGPKAGGPHYMRRLTRGLTEPSGVPEGALVDRRRVQRAVQTAARGLEFSRHKHGAEAGATIDYADEAACLRNPQRDEQADAGQFRWKPEERDGRFQFAPLDLPGPTGESNRLYLASRGVVLCLGPGMDTAGAQLATALGAGNAAVVIADGAEAALARWSDDPRVSVLDGQLAPEMLSTLDGIAAVASCANDGVMTTLRVALAQRPGPILPLISEPRATERYVIERHVCIDTTAAGGNAALLVEAETSR
ncbi:MAG: bifunctional proline dehydrogenase/L-glutamate gamma-semialdehyde dehydrogenase PutA [Rhodospirillales bacterium]|nr:bifunctional proline dehydrogenase/L-glutamate gamma-semialdehyde dehydrogenase PutA [Rhodospirillales bacterium]